MTYIIINNGLFVTILEQEFGDTNITKEHKETINHIYRSHKIAKEFGAFLKLSSIELEILSECALLHDLGKFEIDSKILYKTTVLTETEFSIIKNHINYKPKTIFNDNILNCIKYHHERPDNNGYNNIDYAQVSPFTKIVSIIDAFDVMSNKRSYKTTTLNLESCIVEIEKNIGKQFDDYYGRIFLDFLKTKIV